MVMREAGAPSFRTSALGVPLARVLQIVRRGHAAAAEAAATRRTTAGVGGSSGGGGGTTATTFLGGGGGTSEWSFTTPPGPTSSTAPAFCLGLSALRLRSLGRLIRRAAHFRKDRGHSRTDVLPGGPSHGTAPDDTRGFRKRLGASQPGYRQ